MRKLTIVVLIFLAVFFLSLGGYLFYQYFVIKGNVDEKPQTTLESSESTSSNVVEETINEYEEETEGWIVYEVAEYNFSFKYPSNFAPLKDGLTEKPFYSLIDEVPFGVTLLQNVYVDLGQTPAIKVMVIDTQKEIYDILDQLIKEIADTTIAMQDPESIGYGAKPPEIRNTEEITINGVTATMVDRFGGAYAPNTEYLEYYVKKPDHIVVFKSNYGTYHGDANQDGTLEKELLPAVVSTLKYTQQ